MPFRKPHQTAEPVTPDANGNFIIKPKGLNIIWGNDPRYWKTEEDYAELIQVSWLEVSGKVKVQPGGTYLVKFHVEVKPNGFGWDKTPVLVMAKIGRRGSYEYEEVALVCNKRQIIPEDKEGEKMLTIKVKGDEPDPELHFGLYEVWSGKWKGGLKILKAEVTKI